MKIRNYKIDFENILFYLFGIFSTMPIVGINIGQKSVSFFMILVPIIILILLFKLKYRNILLLSKEGNLLLIFLFLSIVASLFGNVYFLENQEFRKNISTYIPKIMIYIILFLLLNVSNYKRNIIRYLVKGILMGAIINLVWASLDGFIYYMKGFSINNKLFSTYIINNDIRYGMLSLVIEGDGIRTAGFNYDPAHIGMLAPFVFGYAVLIKKKLLIIISILSLIMSQSVTGLACCFFIFVVILIKEKKFKTLLKSIFFIFGLLFSIILIGKAFGSMDGIINFIERILSKFGDNNTESLRMIYNFGVFYALLFSPFQFLIGTGFNTASYPFILSGLINRIDAYDPESTYISYLFDVGIVGLSCYIILLITIYKKSSLFVFKSNYDEMDVIIFAGICAVIFSSFFYHYILYATHMMILITSCIWYKRRNRVECRCKL